MDKIDRTKPTHNAAKPTKNPAGRLNDRPFQNTITNRHGLAFYSANSSPNSRAGFVFGVYRFSVGELIFGAIFRPLPHHTIPFFFTSLPSAAMHSAQKPLHLVEVSVFHRLSPPSRSATKPPESQNDIFNKFFKVHFILYGLTSGGFVTLAKI